MESRSQMAQKIVIRLIPFFFLISYFGFFSLRASSSQRWSWWDFGDTQTMMAATVFRDEGFLATHFLWVPQPSSPIGPYLDDEAVRHHAHGTGGDRQFSGLGPKRMYTHWPSWYSVPYGILAKLGVLNKTVFQIWAALLSVCSLLFFYLFARRLVEDPLAFFAVLIYALSPTFIGYADSLATMPYDDFFRFAFLLAWSTRDREAPLFRRLWLPGLLYLGAFLTSLDSFAFIPVVALVSDYFSPKPVVKKEIALLVGFGSVAMLVQWTQNVAYLGWVGALRDWHGYFLANGGLPISHRFIQSLNLFVRAYNLTLIPCALLILPALIFARRHRPAAFGWLIALALGGISFAFIVPGKIPMDYEDRQLFPFLALAAVLLIQATDETITRYLAQRSIENALPYRPLLRVAALALLIGNFYFFSPQKFLQIADFPAVTHIDQDKLDLFADIAKSVPGHKVYFQVGRVLTSKKFVRPGFGQVSPVDEWYSGGPVLTVPDLSALKEDLNYLWGKVPRQFTPILLIRYRPNEPLTTAKTLRDIEFPWQSAQEWARGEMYAHVLSPATGSIAAR